jgi:hypothetical protein
MSDMLVAVVVSLYQAAGYITTIAQSTVHLRVFEEKDCSVRCLIFWGLVAIKLLAVCEVLRKKNIITCYHGNMISLS